ncbi:MAG: DUF4279 domain-containing protein [Elusimicrobiota bacterium]
MQESIGVRLKISSTTLTAQDIEARLNIKPDESWKIGDLTGAFGAVLKQHGYALDSKGPLRATPAEHLHLLLKRVASVAQIIGELSTQATVEVLCHARCKTLPPFSFTRDDVRWLAALGAKLELDAVLIADRPSADQSKKPAIDGAT